MSASASSNPFLSTSFHLHSSPLSAPDLVLMALEWRALIPTFAQVTLAAREVNLVYRREALALAQPDRSPTRLWLFVNRDQVQDFVDKIGFGGKADRAPVSSGDGDPCQTQAFLQQTQAANAEAKGGKVKIKPLGDRMVALGLSLIKVSLLE